MIQDDEQETSTAEERYKIKDMGNFKKEVGVDAK